MDFIIVNHVSILSGCISLSVYILLIVCVTDLAHEEGILKRWLSDMEDQIQPLTCRLPRGCSLLTLQDRYKDNQVSLARTAVWR